MILLRSYIHRSGRIRSINACISGSSWTSGCLSAMILSSLWSAGCQNLRILLANTTHESCSSYSSRVFSLAARPVSTTKISKSPLNLGGASQKSLLFGYLLKQASIISTICSGTPFVSFHPHPNDLALSLSLVCRILHPSVNPGLWLEASCAR